MNGKTITASVGQGCANIPADVATVQYLLNCVPASHGGPVKELEIDGFAGVLTIQAISRFQELQFGWSDGRVETAASGGVTIGELNKYDPLPFSAPIVAPKYKSPAPFSTTEKSGSKSIPAFPVKNFPVVRAESQPLRSLL